MIKRNKRHIFSELELNIINTLSLIITYIIISSLINIDTTYFGEVTRAIKIALVGVAILLLITEIRKLNKFFGIKGILELLCGYTMVFCFILLKNYNIPENYNKIAIFIYENMLFLTLAITLFSLTKGLIKIFSSLVKSYYRKFKNRKVSILISRIFFMIIEIIGLFSIYISIYQILF